jgi:secreted trypsin-like serine protease
MSTTAGADLAVGGDEKAIVGGANVTIGQFPWEVSVQGWGSHFCGGSIIAPGWVLTANHCVEGETGEGVTVLAGASRLSQAVDGQTRGVARIVRSPGHQTPESGGDVALLQLASPLTLGGDVAAIALATDADAADGAGVTATVSG